MGVSTPAWQLSPTGLPSTPSPLPASNGTNPHHSLESTLSTQPPPRPPEDKSTRSPSLPPSDQRSPPSSRPPPMMPSQPPNQLPRLCRRSFCWTQLHQRKHRRSRHRTQG